MPEQVLGIQRIERIRSQPSATLTGVDGFSGQLLERFCGHQNGPAIVVCGHQVAGTIGKDVDAVAPVSSASG